MLGYLMLQGIEKITNVIAGWLDIIIFENIYDWLKVEFYRWIALCVCLSGWSVCASVLAKVE